MRGRRGVKGRVLFILNNKVTKRASRQLYSYFKSSALTAGIGNTAGKDQRVDGGFSDEEQEGTVGVKHFAVGVEGATDEDQRGGGGGFAALFVHLSKITRFV